MPADITRSKIGDLACRTEEVLLLLVTDFEDLREKLEAEIGNIIWNTCRQIIIFLTMFYMYVL